MRTRSKLLSLVLMSSLSLWGQADANKGSINGTVLDPNQAVIPGASIKATNTATGLVREAKTNDVGQYRFGSLDPGAYEVKADAPGFAPATAKNVLVAVGRAVTVDLTVSVQATVETIEVSATLVSETEVNSSQIVNMQAIQDLPINGRRFQDFATLTRPFRPTTERAAS